MTNLFIFNTDFRVRDNSALFYAAENGESVVAMFIYNPKKWESHNESDLKIAFQIDNLKIISKKLTAFDFYGPTCDSMDYMKGPFLLPNNVKENDYIELGQLGAYGLTFRTEFNGCLLYTSPSPRDRG